MKANATDHAPHRAVRRCTVRLSIACLLTAFVSSQFACKQEEQPPSPSSGIPSTTTQPAKPTPPPAGPEKAKAELIGVSPDWQAAIDAARQVLDGNPQAPEANGRLGILYLAADVSPRAAEFFEAANKLAPDEFKWAYYLGLAKERAYAPADAISAYEAALQIDGNYVPVMLRVSELLKEDAPDKAKSILLRASTLAPNECRIAYMLGRLAYSEDDLDTAVQYLERSVELAPSFASAHKLLADAYEQLNQRADAERHRSMISGGDRLPDLVDPFWAELTSIGHEVLRPLEFAQRLLQQGNAAKAEEILANALRVQPNNENLRRLHGQTLSMLGRYDESLQSLRMIDGSSPQAESIEVDIATVLVEAKQYDEAEAAFKNAMRDSAASPALLRAYGSFLVLMGRSDEAIEILEPLTQLSTCSPQDRLNLFLAYMCTRQFDKAVAQYEFVRRGKQQNMAAQNMLLAATVPMMLRQHRANIPAEIKPAILQPQHFILQADAFAEKKMNEESQAMRNYVQLLANDAMRLADQRYHKEALDYLDDVMSADLGGVLLNTKGAIYGMKGEPEQALACFEQALKINPALSSARSGMVQALMDLGRTSEAGRLLDQIAAERPNDPAALQAYAMMLANAGRLDDALALLARAAELQPKDPTHHQIRAELLGRAGRMEEAMAAAETALKIAPENIGARHLLAVCLHAAGRTTEAKSQWSQIIASNPRLVEPRMALVELAVLDGDVKKAQTLLQDGLNETPNSPLLANALAWSLATCNEPALRHGREAVQLATKACEATRFQQPEFIDTLAAAYAEAGDFGRAVETQKRAIAAAEKRGNATGIEGLKERLALYEAGTPYHEMKEEAQEDAQP